MKYSYRLKAIPIYDLGKMEDYLNQMSLEGMHFVRLKFGLWVFEQGEEKAYDYLCTYIPEITRYEFSDDNKLNDLTKSYLEAGWERIDNREKLCFFRRPKSFSNDLEVHEVPPHISKSVRYFSTLEALKYNFLMSQIILLITGVIVFLTSINQFYRWPTLFFQSPVTVNNTLFWPILSMSTAFSLWDYYRWRRLNSKKMNEVDFRYSSPLLNTLRLVMLLIAIVILFINIRELSSGLLSIGTLAFILGLPFIGLLGYFLNKWIVKWGFDRSVNIGIQVIFIILVVILFQVGLFKSVSTDLDAQRERDEESYDETFTLTTSSGRTTSWQVNHIQVPLEIECLISLEDPKYYTDIYDFKESFLATYTFVAQRTFDFNDALPEPEINYTIFDFKYQWLMDKALDQIMDKNTVSVNSVALYRPVEIQGLEEVKIYYQAYSSRRNNYIFTQKHRLVMVTYSWNPSIEQLQTTYDALF